MPRIVPGDTAWLLAAAALVMFMTPGLALFYGGLVRAKNVLGIVMQSFVALAVVSVLWVLVGYTLAFGPDRGLVVGGLDFLGLNGVGAAPSPLAPTVPASAFMAFQLMFAIITPALITGAFAERMKFSGYLLFLGLWSVLVYAPLAHWVWGGGSSERTGSERSTSLVGRWCTSTRAWPRWRSSCTWASGWATDRGHSSPTTCRW